MWATDAFVYHIYPLAACGAPERNDYRSSPVPRLRLLLGQLDHIASLGVDTLYLGPVFESSTHGYDTADFLIVDRRLGTDDDLMALTHAAHARGMRVIFDAVFNHVGRHFWAFEHVQNHGAASPYTSWISGLNFGGTSKFGDPFTYDCWMDDQTLVKLAVDEPAVREHLFHVLDTWMSRYGIDGIRIDAVDQISTDFLTALSAHARSRRADFWLMGEVVLGDYRTWVRPDMLDSMTSYWTFHALHTSHNLGDYRELAEPLDLQFGPEGRYRGFQLYGFVDNHDVTRIRSNLRSTAQLYPAYGLLFTLPGIPSVYYGSEWGVPGKIGAWGHAGVRPTLEDIERGTREVDLPPAIRRFAAVRRRLPALRIGDYLTLIAGREQFAFARWTPEQTVIVVANQADHAVPMSLNLAGYPADSAIDVLNGDEPVWIEHGTLHTEVPSNWLRVIELHRNA